MSDSQPPIAPPGSNVPNPEPTRPGDGSAEAGTTAPGGTGAASATSATPPKDPDSRGSRFRRAAVVLVVLVVLIGVGVGVVLFVSRGDGTKRTANPLEVRRLVATFACTPENPTTPENLRLTAGQEVVRVPRAGCAVVGDVVGQVDRLQKVDTKTSNGTCTVTLDAPEEYGQAVDAASNVSDGQVRALVAGGWLLDVRAVIDYPGRPSGPLHVAFSAPDPTACTAVSSALALQ